MVPTAALTALEINSDTLAPPCGGNDGPGQGGDQTVVLPEVDEVRPQMGQEAGGQSLVGSGAGLPVVPVGAEVPVVPDGAGLPVVHDGAKLPDVPDGAGLPVVPDEAELPVSPAVPAGDKVANTEVVMGEPDTVLSLSARKRKQRDKKTVSLAKKVSVREEEVMEGELVEEEEVCPGVSQPLTDSQVSVGSVQDELYPVLQIKKFLQTTKNNKKDDGLDRNHSEPHATSKRAMQQLVVTHCLADVWRGGPCPAETIHLGSQ
ncbi:hypothetical protein FQN60_009271 [Etheostoma spectabile]|uniref:Uncharacterized protein n=1 Tax=Etheostoma spectabile TaxID=54343 RepID=A0A5J5DIG7_9PERO|nr:hypothetical protein FQN60_009271 [Etheostoma spectabile]